jgi:hypothetical protein
MWNCDRDWQRYGVYKMGLLLAEGKRLKHLKKKRHHKIPYHDLILLWSRTPQQTLRTQRNLKTSCAIPMMKIIIIIIIMVVLFLVMEHRWNEIDRGRLKYSGKTYPSATLSTTNPTWTDTGSNPGIRSGRPAANRLSHGTTLNHKLHQREHCLRILVWYFI